MFTLPDRRGGTYFALSIRSAGRHVADVSPTFEDVTLSMEPGVYDIEVEGINVLSSRSHFILQVHGPTRVTLKRYLAGLRLRPSISVL
jgi:hypothetical protein